MEYENLYELLSEINIPVAYDHFPDNKTLEPPFMTYREQPIDSLMADNKNYAIFRNFEIELVTTKKDIVLEKRISDLFINNDIPYEMSDEVWDNEEKIYHIFYEI